jgi:hypothetical protein
MVVRSAVVVGAVCVALAACSSGSKDQVAAPSPTPTTSSTSASSTSTPKPAPTRSAAPSVSALSGRPGKNGPVLIVKIDNTRKAHPQTGLSKADVVYIEPVEGGLTRVAAVFSSQVPDKIGPVRSARITDLDLVRQYGRAAFAFSGAQSKLLPSIARAPLYDVSFDRAPGAYWRQSGRPAPYDLFTDGPKLLRRAKDAQVAHDVGFRFGAAAAGGRPARSVVAHYAAARVGFQWDPQQHRWLWSMDGRPAMASEGGQLGGTTIVIQYVTIGRSPYHDVNGVTTPWAKTVGKGSAVILRDGRAYDAQWSRPQLKSGTRLTAGGKDVPLAPGQVWVVLVDKTRPVSVS